MNAMEEFRLQEYQDLGPLDEDKAIRLKRHERSGIICLEKRVPLEKKPIYQALLQKHIAGVPEFFVCAEDGQELVVIEKYIEGKSLENLLQERTLTEEEILDILLPLCDTLEALHHGPSPIICRDLKAENIIVGLDGEIWLVDFDIARFFQKGKRRDTELLGTAEYAAPEQFGFFQTDQRTDIYSMGVLLNYMVTGRFPVEQMTAGRFKPVVDTCTYLDPERRYQDIAELKKELLKICGKDVEPQKDGWREWLPPGFRQGNLLHMILAVMGYLGIGWFAFDTDMGYFVERCILWLTGMAFVLIVWNYRGVRNHVPLLNHQSVIVQGIAIVLLGIILSYGCIFGCALVETLFYSS